jgi:hypothetical protein
MAVLIICFLKHLFKMTVSINSRTGADIVNKAEVNERHALQVMP